MQLFLFACLGLNDATLRLPKGKVEVEVEGLEEQRKNKEKYIKYIIVLLVILVSKSVILNFLIYEQR